MRYFLASLCFLVLPLGARAALIDDIQYSVPLDETSGTRNDEHADILDLTDNNTVGYTTGKSGNAALFEADNLEYLSYTPTFVDYSSADWSFSIWARSDGNSSQYRGLIGNRFGTVGSWMTLGANITTGYLTFEDCGAHSTSVHDGQWHHYVVTHDDAATDLIKVYKDGTQVISCSGLSVGGTTNDLRLGLWYEGSQYWDGAMDEFYWFDTVLDTTAVTALYASGNGFFYPFTEAAPAAAFYLSSTTPAGALLGFSMSALGSIVISFLVLILFIIFLETLYSVLGYRVK